MNDSINAFIKLENIHCLDEDDGAGDAEPYLLTAFFKIDGETLNIRSLDGVPGGAGVEGTVMIVSTPSGQGDLGGDMGAGDYREIPADIGEFRTVLRPITFTDLNGHSLDTGTAFIGAVVILMEQDSTPDSAIADGYQAFINAFQGASQTFIQDIDKTVKTSGLGVLLQRAASGNAITDAERRDIESRIKSAFRDAVIRSMERNLFIDLLNPLSIKALVTLNFALSVLDPDDEIGSEIFYYAWPRLQEINSGGIPIYQRWQGSDGDWELRGRIVTSPAELPPPVLRAGTGEPRWSDWHDLGGDLASSPAAVSREPDRADCFATGTNQHMIHKWWDGDHWSEWEDLGGELSSAPAAVSWGPNRIDCFARGLNGHLWHLPFFHGQPGAWEDLGDLLDSGPAAVSWSFNRIDCIMRGVNGSLQHKWWDGNQWSELNDLGGSLTSAPAISSWGIDRLDCFARGENGHLWHKWWG